MVSNGAQRPALSRKKGQAARKPLVAPDKRYFTEQAQSPASTAKRPKGPSRPERVKTEGPEVRRYVRPTNEKPDENHLDPASEGVMPLGLLTWVALECSLRRGDTCSTHPG